MFWWIWWNMPRRGSATLMVATMAASWALMAGPAAAEAEIYSATATNEQGISFALLVQKDGNWLRFDIATRGDSAIVNGIPYCESTELKTDGRFVTYCRKFIPGESVRLAGTLSEATLSPIYGLGGATFRFQPGLLKD
jgi:hypothetical protein